MSLYDNIVSYWRFDEYTGSAIDIVGSNDGTVGVGVTKESSGIVNNSYYFSGISTAYVDVGTIAGLTGDFTISFWYKGTHSGTFAGLISNYNATVDGIHIYLGFTGYVNASIAGVYVIYGATTPVNDDSWHMITVVRSGSLGSNGYLYIDGVLDSQGSLSTVTATSATNTIKIGAYSDGSSPVIGYIDEIGIWDRSLTEEEIEILYNDGLGNTYPFNAYMEVKQIKCGLAGGYWDDTDTWIDTDTWED